MEPPIIYTADTLREVIAADFEMDLPIGGGWGYSLNDAIIIDKNDASVQPNQPFPRVSLEYTIVEKRIFEELITFRGEGDRFSGIEWKLIDQRILNHGERTFDHLKFDVTALHDRDWNELKAEWNGPNGHSSSTFDQSAHLAERERRKVRYCAEYWFDITSFY